MGPGRFGAGALALAVALGLGCADPLGLGCAEECAESGRCGRRTWAAGDGLVRCFPRSDDDCRQSRDCAERGARDPRPQTELARCLAAQPASCAASAECASHGRCRPDPLGRCVVTEAGCVDTPGCREADRCKAAGDGCRVPDGDGPLCADACRVEGACTEVDGRCVATSDDACRDSHLCRSAGVCALGPDGTCVAASDADCAASAMCEWNGFCAAREGVCTRGLTVCQDTCLEQGWCGVVDAVCVPRDDADCEASLACLVLGACGRSTAAGRPVCRPRTAVDCAASLEGRAYGRVELRPTACAAPGAPPYPLPDGRCFRDPACADEGRCLTSPTGACERPEAFGLPPIPAHQRPRVRLPR